MCYIGEPIPQGKGIFGGNVAAHCTVMALCTVRCAKTAELIDMPFWMKTLVVPWNHVLDGSPDPQGEGEIFGSCTGIQEYWQSSLQRSLQRGSFNHQ